MEVLIVFTITLLAAGGIGLGLMLTGRPPSDSCGSAGCAGHCELCPRRKETMPDG